MPYPSAKLMEIFCIINQNPRNLHNLVNHVVKGVTESSIDRRLLLFLLSISLQHQIIKQFPYLRKSRMRISIRTIVQDLRAFSIARFKSPSLQQKRLWSEVARRNFSVVSDLQTFYENNNGHKPIMRNVAICSL